jgi:adenylate kinase family enzyme
VRILVAGGPRVGKTTLAAELGREHGIDPRHTDDLIGVREWSEASDVVARWIGNEDPWIIEGVAVVRGLRKWLAVHSGKPADLIYIGEQPHEPLTPRQLGMARGHATMWDSVYLQLRQRGMQVLRF